MLEEDDEEVIKNSKYANSKSIDFQGEIIMRNQSRNTLETKSNQVHIDGKRRIPTNFEN
jgi:hypothetical protein